MIKVNYGYGGTAVKVIIVGAGKVGYTIASYLAKEDHDITVIDRDASRLEYVGNALDVICVEGLCSAGGRGDR